MTTNNKVLQQSENLVTIETSTNLIKGQILLFDEAVSGIVIRIDPPYYIARLDKTIPVKTFRLKNWWKPANPPDFQRKVSKLFFTPSSINTAILELECLVPPNYIAGTIGWELLFQVNKNDRPLVIACGNDYSSPGICKFNQKNALWLRGVYTLIAKRFNPVGLISLSEGSSRWILTAEAESLNLSNSLSNQLLNLV